MQVGIPVKNSPAVWMETMEAGRASFPAPCDGSTRQTGAWTRVAGPKDIQAAIRRAADSGRRPSSSPWRRNRGGRDAAVVPAGPLPGIPRHPWDRRPEAASRLTGSTGPAFPNCSSSVDPLSAAVDACPPEIVICRASKYPVPTKL